MQIQTLKKKEMDSCALDLSEMRSGSSTEPSRTELLLLWNACPALGFWYLLLLLSLTLINYLFSYSGLHGIQQETSWWWELRIRQFGCGIVSSKNFLIFAFFSNENLSCFCIFRVFCWTSVLLKFSERG